MALFCLCIILYLTRGCGDKNNGNVTIDVIKPADSTHVEHIREKPLEPITIVKTDWKTKIDTFYDKAKIDTSALFNEYLKGISVDSLVGMIGERRLLAVYSDYFYVKYYSDTIIGENDYEAIINDSVTMNRITDRKFYLKNLREDRVVTIDPTKRKLLVGGFVGDKMDAFNIGGSIGYMDKKNNMFQYQYGFLDQSHRIGFMTTITFKKQSSVVPNILLK